MHTFLVRRVGPKTFRPLVVAIAFILIIAIGVVFADARGAHAAPACDFALGFKGLRDLIPEQVGGCLEPEGHTPENGDAVQRTTAHHGRGGLLVWRKRDNWTAFTDGNQTWINGPFGVQQRLNVDCFSWEVCPGRPAPSEVSVATDEIVRGDPTRPWVSLIFNAGAGYQPAPAILRTLREKDVRTTFFLMGWWAEKEPELVRAIAAEGHEIASHGNRIFDLTQSSDAEVTADLARADDIIRGITARTTRPLWSASAGYRDTRVHRIAASLGYRPIFWTVDGGDWRLDSTAEGVRQRVVNGATNGAIIVMHFESPRTVDTIAPVLPSIIDGLRARGFTLVTISELVAGHRMPNQ